MWNIKFKKIVAFSCILLFQPMVGPGSRAFAKKKAPRAFSFIVEEGKASQGECDGEWKIPRRLKHLKEFTKSSSYLGSELQVPEVKGESDKEMWKHFFRVKASCNTALAKTPSSIQESTLKDLKKELPPEESVDSDDDVHQNDPADSE